MHLGSQRTPWIVPGDLDVIDEKVAGYFEFKCVRVGNGLADRVVNLLKRIPNQFEELRHYSKKLLRGNAIDYN